MDYIQILMIIKLFDDNHDDGETIASIQCNICGHLCIDCDRFLHLNTAKTRTHKRHVSFFLLLLINLVFLFLFMIFRCLKMIAIH